MKNVVSFETAKRLKEAGFPQPEPEVGQFWYRKHPSLAITLEFAQSVEPDENGGSRFYTLWVGTEDTGGKFYDCKKHDLIFAPTSTDILRELYPAGKKVIIGSNRLLAMALDPAAAAEKWIERNAKW